MKKPYHIRILKPHDIEEVVAIHKNTMKSIGSTAGKRYLTQLYALVLKDKRVGFGMVGEKAKPRTIVGSILVMSDGETYGNVWHYLSDPILVWDIVLGILSGKIRIQEFLQHRKFQHAVSPLFQKPYFSIHALSIASILQGKGIGTTLVQAVIRKAQEEHIKQIYVDTLLSNIPAQKFYHAVGFHEVTRKGDSILYVFEV